MKLFPATEPLKDSAMDLLGEILQTPRGYKYFLVIVDRYTKLVRTVSLSSIRAIDVARAFCKHWVFTYGPPVTVLTDNGKQFNANLL